MKKEIGKCTKCRAPVIKDDETQKIVCSFCDTEYVYVKLTEEGREAIRNSIN